MHNQKSLSYLNFDPSDTSSNKHPFSTPFISTNSIKLSSKKYISLMKDQLYTNLKQYQWRMTTQFPIIKILSYKITQTNPEDYTLQIQTEQIITSLHDIKQISLSKCLYLLKETMIGCERLYNRYGTFKVGEKMITINRQNKCKIWFNVQYQSNLYQKDEGTQGQFIQKIINIFKQKVNIKGQLFFKGIKDTFTFSGVVKYIDEYAKNNKITIPTYYSRFQFNPPILNDKFSHVQNEKQKTSFNPNLTMNRSPKFLQRRRNSPKERHQSIERQLKESQIKVDRSFVPSFLQLKKMHSLPLQYKEQMKISGQTKVDMKDSNNSNNKQSKNSQNSHDNKLQLIKQSSHSYIKPTVSLFSSHKQIQKKYVHEVKDPLHQSSKQTFHFKRKQALIKRAGSNQFNFNCFTPQPQRPIKNQHNTTFTSNWKNSLFLNDQSRNQTSSKEQQYNIHILHEQQQIQIQNQLDSLFTKNNWQNKIEGLFVFNDGKGLKRSFQEGEEPKWRKGQNQRQLSLLNSIKGELFQSNIMQ